MRFEVDLPDDLYNQVSSAAKSGRSSMNNFVKEAVAAYVANSAGGDDVIVLSEEQLEKVRVSQLQFKAGKSYTASEVDDHFQTLFKTKTADQHR